MLGTADETALTAQKPRRRALRRHKSAPMTHTPAPMRHRRRLRRRIRALRHRDRRRRVAVLLSPTDTPTKRDGDNATRQAAEKKKPPHPFFPGWTRAREHVTAARDDNER